MARFRLAALLACTLVFPALADDMTPTIVMTGQGIVRAAPDLATVSIGVRSDAAAADKALADNAAQMRGLLGAVDAAGIPKADVQTAAVTLEPQFAYTEGQQPRLTGYLARNVVSVQVRDLGKLGQLLQAAVSAGGNELSGLAYDFADRDPLAARARTEAVFDARRKADGVAAAAGVKLGRVLRIEEAGEERPRPMPRAMLAEAKGGVPVEAGTEEVSQSVTVTWEIAP